MVHSNKLTLFALCVGTFVVMLDTTIMNIALPQIHTELSASFSELSWALNAYTILFAALTIPSANSPTVQVKSVFTLEHCSFLRSVL